MLIWPTLLLVLGSVLQASAQSVPGVSVISAKPSGALCGNTRCLSQSSCIIANNCQCPAGKTGQGTFHCYAKNSKNTDLSGVNNNIRTYSNQVARLLWPCRVRITEVDLTSSTSNQRLKVQVFGINKRSFGRPLLSGLEVNLQVKDGDKVKGIGLLKTGVSRNGTYTYKEWGRLGFQQEPPITGFNPSFASSDLELDGSGSGDESGDDGSANSGGGGDGGGECLPGGGVDDEDDENWGEVEDLVEDFGVRFALDDDNFARIALPEFSLSLGFRAPSVAKTGGRQVSGMFLEYTGDQSQFLLTRPETYAAGGLPGQTNFIDPSNDRFLDRAMFYAAKQPATPLGKMCTATACVYRATCGSTSLRLKAVRECIFLMKNSNLIQCMDPVDANTGESSTFNNLKAFKLCLWNSCNPSRSVCTLFKSYFKPECLKLAPTAIQNLNCLKP